MFITLQCRVIECSRFAIDGIKPRLFFISKGTESRYLTNQAHQNPARLGINRREPGCTCLNKLGRHVGSVRSMKLFSTPSTCTSSVMIGRYREHQYQQTITKKHTVTESSPRVVIAQSRLYLSPHPHPHNPLDITLLHASNKGEDKLPSPSAKQANRQLRVVYTGEVVDSQLKEPPYWVASDLRAVRAVPLSCSCGDLVFRCEAAEGTEVLFLYSIGSLAC